jgi:16S rRNA (uracil1498-N3)-methyltransferase
MTTVIVEVEQFEQQTLELSADSFHHLFRVRRLRAGDVLRVVDGRGHARQGQVARIGRHAASLELGEPVPTNEAGLSLELLVAAPRPQRAAWLVEKVTEIGVMAVRFFRSRRSPRTYGTATLNRLVRSARAAVEQSDRSRVPEVTGVHDWPDLSSLVGGSDMCFVLDPTARQSSFDLPIGTGTVRLLVGPEGGWDRSEIEAFEHLACRFVSLGPRILRVETAALVGAAALLVTPSVDTL